LGKRFAFNENFLNDWYARAAHKFWNSRALRTTQVRRNKEVYESRRGADGALLNRDTIREAIAVYILAQALAQFGNRFECKTRAPLKAA